MTVRACSTRSSSWTGRRRPAPTPERPSADAIWIGTASRAGRDEPPTAAPAPRPRRCWQRCSTPKRRPDAACWRGSTFPFGYPEGFAAPPDGSARGRARSGTGSQRTLRRRPTTANNRFPRWPLRSTRSLGGRGPFWGRPRSLPLPHLPETQGGRLCRAWPCRAASRSKPRCRARSRSGSSTRSRLGRRAGADRASASSPALASAPGCAVWPFDPPTAPRLFWPKSTRP